MNANIPVLPIAGGALVRGFAGAAGARDALAQTASRAPAGTAARRSMLAGLDRHMLADIGITRSDLRDAFSEPFWDDPTALLRERAIERRLSAAPRAHSGASTWRTASTVRRPTARRARRSNEIHQTAEPSRRPLDPGLPRSSPLASGSKRPPAPPAGAFFLAKNFCAKTPASALACRRGEALRQFQGRAGAHAVSCHSAGRAAAPCRGRPGAGADRLRPPRRRLH